MAEEEKGFIIKDKRSFGKEGEKKEEANETPVDTAEKKESKAEKSQSSPLPEVNFNSLIFSLSSSALLHLGEIPDPQTQSKKEDFQLAKHSIDIIAMLKDKTSGNLNEEEQKFIDSILTDLRMRYVKAIKGKKS